MHDILAILIALIWLASAWLRVYRQARFYQIEEYMSLRYLRWLLRQRERWLPTRAALAGGLGAVLALFMSEAPGGLVAGFVSIVSATIAAVPPDEGEIKKAFRATPRAKRMLAAAFVTAGVMMLVGQILVSPLVDEYRFIAAGLVGLLILLGAPLWLIAGNLLMTPIEAFNRRRFIASAQRVLEEINPVVIGITGSYGKTSTKHYLSHILNGRYKTYPTPKSYNTMMGVSMAINNDLTNDRSIDYFIAEMGAYIPGEIAQLCDLTKPTIGIEVEVGPQHLERFGSLENTAAAKYELIKALPPDGVGVFNWDNPYIRQMYERGYPATRLGVSRELDPEHVPLNGPRFIASETEESLAGLRFIVTDMQTGEQIPFETPVLGLHNITNMLLATATAVHEGMKLHEIARRVATLQPAESRLVRQNTAQGITVINDAYSANPAGAVSALRVLGMYQQGKRLLITPGMVELGPLMESENRKLGETAAQYTSDVILVGPEQTKPIQAGLLAAGFPPERLQIVNTLAEAVQWYQNNLKSGDAVLFLNDLPDTYSS
jgi:UDP-N-acetylmuramoyl-tripeptide--D-alanyl-D-alanine ligase